jgi:putative inorganic carbon (hco3(-)) transporter
MFNPLRPFFYLLAYVAVLYLRPQEYWPALMDTPLVPVLLLWTAFLWLVAAPKKFAAPQHGLMLGLMLGMFMSLLMVGWLGGAIDVVKEFAPTLLLFYMVATWVNSEERFQNMATLLTVVTTVLAVHGIRQAATEDGVGWTGAQMIDGRITYVGLLNDPNDLSMVFLMALPFMFYLAKALPHFVLRWGSWGAVGTTLYATYLCNSRGSVLGLLAMTCTYAVRRFGWWRSVLVLPLLLAPILLLAPSRMNDMSADEESAAGRVDAWFEGFDMFKSHPLFGIGKGLFTDHNPLTAHNSFVLAIAELGLFGYFFWLSIVAVSVLMVYRLVRSPEPQLQPMASALAYSLMGTLVAAFFLSRSYVVYLFLLIALVVAVYQMARTCWPDALVEIKASAMLGKLVLFELATIVFLWLLTRILLMTS